MPRRSKGPPSSKTYWNVNGSKTISLRCRKCFDSLQRMPAMLIGDYLKHVKQVHELPLNTHCPWCYTALRKKFAKNNLDHLIPCRENYLKENRCLPHVPAEEANDEHPEDVEPDSSIPMCEEHCHAFESVEFWDRGHSRVYGVDGFYEPCDFEENVATTMDQPLTTREEAIVSNTLMFTEESGLGSEAVQFLKQYVRTRRAPNVGWYHLMVKACAYKSFLEQMNRVASRVRILPYWCICDGTKHPDWPATHIHHRHMIAVTDDQTAFVSAWEGINIDSGDKRYSEKERCKQSIHVEDEFHFVNLLAYVSHEKSSCTGFNKPEKGEEIDPCLRRGSSKMCHYFIRRTTFPHSRLALHLLLPGGVQNYLWRAVGKKYVYPFLSHVTRRHDQLWTVPVKHIFSIFNCLLPFAGGMVPDSSVAKRNNDPFLIIDEVVPLIENGDRVSAFAEFWKQFGERVYALQKTQRQKARELYEYSRIQERAMKQQVDDHQKRFQITMDAERQEFRRAQEQLLNENERLKVGLETSEHEIQRQKVALQMSEKRNAQTCVELDVAKRCCQYWFEQWRLKDEDCKRKDEEIARLNN